ncbi:MAG: carbohydrate kinase [Pseudanabaenaceae cyanobacterium bins.68]|nr:carbohydrate kinase [Pseudanabaenaceae cyanobacterium bins.68]
MVKVLCLGEVLLDRINGQAYPGGAPANVAIALAKLGTTVGFIGCVGQDQVGQELLSQLNHAGVDTTGVQIHPQAATREVFVKLDQAGTPEFARFVGDADTYLAAELLPSHIFAEADFLVLGTLMLASPVSSRAVARALKLAEQYYLKVVVDLNWREIFWQNPAEASKLIQIMLDHVDFLKLSASEAQLFFRTTSPAAIAQALPELEGVIVTDGAADCRYYFGNRQGRSPSFAIKPVDTVGAGDAFLAGFIHQICQRSLTSLADPEGLEMVIRYAQAVAAISTQALGASSGLPSDPEVRTFLQNYSCLS